MLVGRAVLKKVKRNLPRFDRVQYKLIFKNEKINSNTQLQNVVLKVPDVDDIQGWEGGTALDLQ